MKVTWLHRDPCHLSAGYSTGQPVRSTSAIGRLPRAPLVGLFSRSCQSHALKYVIDHGDWLPVTKLLELNC